MTLREKHQQGKFTITVELDPQRAVLLKSI